VPVPPLVNNWPLRTDDPVSQLPPEPIDEEDDDGCAGGT
jgi:hypothetical protein